MKEKTTLFHVHSEFPPHAAAGVEPAFYFLGHCHVPLGSVVQSRVIAVPGGVGRAEELPPLVSVQTNLWPRTHLPTGFAGSVLDL